MAIIRNFRELRAYQQARIEAKQEFDLAWQAIGGMINNMIVKADDFCRNAS